MGSGGDPTPLVPAAHFNYTRVPRDRLWALLFALAWLAAIAGGIYAVQHRNPAILHLDDPAVCPYDPSSRAHRALLESLADRHAGDFSLPQFMRLTGRWLAVSAVAALALGLVFVRLFQHHSAAMTKATIYSQVAIPAVLAVAALAAGQLGGGLLFGGLALLTVWVFSLWRQQIDLATRLLGVSAHGLAANSGVIGATVLLNVASLVAIAPLGVLAAFALSNGDPAPNPAREGRQQCVDAAGQEVPCCTWNPNAFAQAYMGCALVVVLWTMLLANQIRVFVTSGAVAQWYFAPASLSGPPRGTTLRSLKHALGPSFGSLCLSSLVLTVSQMMREALEQAQDEGARQGSALMVVLACCAQLFWSLVEYLTKFATVFAAITGDAFLEAGRRVTDLLARNFLNAFASTVWFTPLVIRLACFLLAGAWGLLSGGAYYALHRGSALEATPGANAALLGGAVALLTLFILSFLGGILLSVLDAVFVCYALDKDAQTVSHPEIYEVFALVPVSGAVVEQPGGEVAYGAEQGQAGAYQPPSVARV